MLMELWSPSPRRPLALIAVKWSARHHDDDDDDGGNDDDDDDDLHPDFGLRIYIYIY